MLAAAGEERQARLALGLVRQRAPVHPAARLVRAALAELGAATDDGVERDRTGAGSAGATGMPGATVGDAMPLERALLVLGFELADVDGSRVRDVTPHSTRAVPEPSENDATAAALASSRARAAPSRGSSLAIVVAAGAVVLAGAHWGWTGAAAAALVVLLAALLRR